MTSVRSADGTEIAFRTGGDGEPVLFVHGALASASDWVFVARLLRDRFSTVTMDRRGRGRSAFGTEPYAIEREAEDVAAVMQATGARAVVGHSYGGMCAMRALAQGAPIERLVLYEPPVSVPAERSAGIPRLKAGIAAGRLDEAAAGFLREVGANDDEIALIRASPAWPVVIEAVSALPRELEQCAIWRTPEGPFDVPALLILGADTTSSSYLDGVPGIESAFPRLRRAELPGQNHVGHVFAAEAFAGLVADFLCA
jgi:pimeloyl-ACP methyl ester carboxylesterase